MRTVLIVLFTLALALPLTLYCQTQPPNPVPAALAAAPGQPASAPLTVDERLGRLESNMDQLLGQVGRISARTSLADFMERRFADLEKQLNGIQRDLDQLENEVRRLDNRR